MRDVTDELARTRHLEDLVELSAEGILDVDADGTIRYANVQAAELVGADRAAALVGTALGELFILPAETPDALVERLCAGGPGQPRRLQARVRHPHDDGRWAQLAARPRFDAAGALARMTVVVTDITEHKQRERELDEARRHLEEAHLLAGVGHWHADLRTGALEWSPTVYRIFGLDPEVSSPDAQLFYDAVHPDDLEVVLASQRRSMRTGLHDVVHRIVRPDGEVRVVHELARSVVGDDGELERLVGTVQDVTELTRTERALRHSEEALRRVLVATTDGWWDLDLVSGEATYSERWWELHGYEPGSLEVDVELWRRLMNPEDLQRMDDEVVPLLARGESLVEFVARARHRDGHEFPVRLRGLVDYADDGTPIRLSGTTTDISDSQRAERLQETFVSMVSHELRTPLTAITGVLELLEANRAGTIDETARDMVAVARRNTRRLRRLIDDLLDVEQLQRERAAVPVVVSLSDLVARAVSAADAEAAQAQLALRSQLPTPEVLVAVVPSRIVQVIGNLLANAIKYAPSGGEVAVCADVREQHVRVEVRDPGPGVPETFGPRLFDRFSQADPSDPRNRGGAGLGLAIARTIVEQHGGQVGYERVGDHTVVWFTLPVHERTSGTGRWALRNGSRAAPDRVGG